MTTIYHYHPQTGELLDTSEADPSPLEPGVFLVPAFATQTAPPTVPDGQIAIHLNGAWALVPDWHGETKTVYGYSPTTGEFTGEKQAAYIAYGVLEKLDDTTETAPPSAPNKIACFENGAWVLKDDAPMRERMWNAIKAERDRRQLEGGVKVGANWFLSTDRAASEYNTILNVTAGMPDSTVIRAGWRTMNGALVDMTPALARQILTAGIAHRAAIDDAAQAHKAAMQASADPASYDFSTGWPPVFGEPLLNAS